MCPIFVTFVLEFVQKLKHLFDLERDFFRLRSYFILEMLHHCLSHFGMDISKTRNLIFSQKQPQVCEQEDLREFITLINRFRRLPMRSFYGGGNDFNLFFFWYRNDMDGLFFNQVQLVPQGAFISSEVGGLVGVPVKEFQH